MMASAIGIDLGTVYSCVAVCQNSNVQIIANEQGNGTTPSVVAFSGNDILVGESAKNQKVKNYANTIFGEYFIRNVSVLYILYHPRNSNRCQANDRSSVHGAIR